MAAKATWLSQIASLNVWDRTARGDGSSGRCRQASDDGDWRIDARSAHWSMRREISCSVYGSSTDGLRPRVLQPHSFLPAVPRLTMWP